MPKIQRYEAQVDPRGVGGALSSPGAFGSAAPAVGESLGRAVDFLEQKAERDQYFGIQNDMAKVRGDWTQRLADLEGTAEPGAPDFTKRVLAEYDDAMLKMREGRSLSREMTARLATEQEQTRNSLMARALAFEGQAKAQKRRTDALGYSAQVSRNAFVDPAMAQTELDRLPSALAALGLSGAPLEEMQRQVAGEIAESAVRGLTDRGHIELARQALKEGPLATHLNGDQAAALSRGIDAEERRIAAEAERRQAVARAAAMTEVQVLQSDVMAAIEVNGKSPDEARLKRALAVAYGEKPEIAARLTAQIDNAKSFYTVRQSVALTSPAEDAQTLEDMRTRASGQNAAQFVQQAGQLQQAIAAKYRDLRADPFAYVVRTDPEVGRMLTEGAQDPETFRRGVARANELQGRLGVPLHQRAYLGQTAASQLAQTINGGDPEKAANEIENLRNRYGAYFPNVVAELQEAKLAPAFVTIARMDRPEDAVPRVNLATANQIGATELKKTLGETRAKAISDRILQEVETYSPAMARQGTYANRLLTADVQSIEALALLYARQGASDSEAATRAYKEVIGNRYDFEGSWLAPKGLGGKASAAAQAALDALTPADLVPERGGDPALTDEYRRGAALQEARRQGIWLNTPSGDGIMLVTPRGPVIKADGKPVVVTFRDMAAPAQAAPSMGGVAP